MITLKYLNEFKKALANYQASEEARRLLKADPLVVLAGISGGGRNTMIQQLVKSAGYYYAISDTTRPPRRNNGVLEKDGSPYWFKTEQEVLQGVERGRYVAPAIIHNQQVSGIGLQEIKTAKDRGLIAISEIETLGVDQTLKLIPGSLVPIFVLPPSYPEWMRRWTGRGHMADQEKQNRLASSRKELSMALNKDYYHFVINDDLNKAVSGVKKIVAGKIDPKHELAGRQLAEEILANIE